MDWIAAVRAIRQLRPAEWAGLPTRGCRNSRAVLNPVQPPNRGVDRSLGRRLNHSAVYRIRPPRSRNVGRNRVRPRSRDRLPARRAEGVSQAHKLPAEGRGVHPTEERVEIQEEAIEVDEREIPNVINQGDKR